MSHYNKSWGYYYGWWKNKDKKKGEEKKDGTKSSTSSLPTKTTTPVAGSGGSSAYGGYSGYEYYDDYDYYDSDCIDYKEAYRSRYKSSLGYSSGSLSSSAWSYGSGSWYGGGSYYGGYGTLSSDKFDSLKQVIVRAVKEARDLVVILDFPFDVKVTFSGDAASGLPKNSRRIFVATDMLSDSDYSEQDKIQLFCGYAVHEAAHLKHTEYKVVKTFEEMIKESSKINDKRTSFIKLLTNLIEDERVEDKLLKERPGFIEFIEKEKTHMCKKFIKACEAIKDSDISLFLINLCKMIRFPENIDVDILKKYEEVYNKIGEIIIPLPQTTKESCLVALQAYKIIDKMFNLDNFEIKYEDTEGYGFDKLLSEIMSKIAQAGEDSAYHSILYGSDEDSGIEGGGSLIDKSLRDRKTAETLDMMAAGTAFEGESKDTFFKKAPGDAATYDSAKKAISKYIPGVRKLIKGHDKNYEFNIYGCRAGLLDTTKLAEAYQGVPQVYIRKGQVKTNKTAVCVLIDESGSMGAGVSCSSYKTRSDVAREGGVLLNEALKAIPGIELFIYGHTADSMYSGATEINVYREGSSSSCPEFALGSSNYHYENRDGRAILEVAKRVRKLTNTHCLMFILSDGYPAAHNYYGYSAMMDVHEKVKQVEKMDFDVVQISITEMSEIGKMFDHHIDLSGNVANLAKNLSEVIKKLVVKDKTTVVVQ